MKNFIITLDSKGKISLGLLFVFLFLIIFPLLYLVQNAQAVAPQQAYLRLDRIKASTTTGGTVCLKTAASDSGIEAQVDVEFPTGFTVNATAANWTVTTTNLPSGATAWPSISTATAVSSQIVTFPSANLTANTLYCFNFASSSTLTNATAGDSKTGKIRTETTSGAATVEEANIAVSIISEDQVTVSATVPPIFTLSLSGTSIAHGTLTAGTVGTGSVTATIGTNATAGWIAWIKAGAANLASAGTGATISSPGSVDDATTSLSSSTYGWVLDAITTDSANGTGTVSQAAGYGAEYAGGTTCSSSVTGGTLSTTFQPLAASSGTTDGDTVQLCSLVRVASYQTAATDYTQTLTFTAAGRF